MTDPTPSDSATVPGDVAPMQREKRNFVPHCFPRRPQLPRKTPIKQWSRTRMEFWPVAYKKWRWALLPFIGELPIASGIAHSKRQAQVAARKARQEYLQQVKKQVT